MVQIHNLPYGSRWKEQYERVIRWYVRFTDIHNGKRYGEDFGYYYDEILVFFIFCHQLKDWIKKDTKISNDEVEQLITDNECLHFCADIANGTKHLELNNPRINSESDQYPRMKSVVLLDENTILPDGTFPLTGLRFRLSLDDGRQLEAFEIASNCLQIWKDFLIEKGLIE